MDAQMSCVESYVGEIGKNCNTRIVEKKASNLKAWTINIESQSTRLLGYKDESEWLADASDGR